MSANTKSQPDFAGASDSADALAYQARYLRGAVLAQIERTTNAARLHRVGLLGTLAQELAQAAEILDRVSLEAASAQARFRARGAWQADPDRGQTLTEELQSQLDADGIVATPLTHENRVWLTDLDREALRAEARLAEDVKWVKDHGGDEAGYIARYGKADDPYDVRYGDGGPAIYEADMAAVAKSQAYLDSVLVERARRSTKAR